MDPTRRKSVELGTRYGMRRMGRDQLSQGSAMTRRIWAVLLDLDGTLLDHEGAARAAFFAACMQWLPDLDRETLPAAYAEWRRLETAHMRAYLDRTVTFQEQRRARLRGVLSAFGRDGSEIGDDEADDLFATYLRHYEKSWLPYSDVPEVMPFLVPRLGTMIV